MPDIAARPGSLTLAVQASARSPGTLTARIAPAPPSRGAADPCCPTRSPPPLRATSTTRGRCLNPTSATDPQHEHPQNRSIPSPRSPCGDLRAGESPVDAGLPASAVLLTLSSSGGEERRTPCRRCPAAAFSAARSAHEARPLTLPVTRRSVPREAGQPGWPGTLSPRLRQETRLPRSRAPSIDRCPLAARLRRLRRDRHHPRGVAAFESAPDIPLRHPGRSSGRRFRSLPSVLPGSLHCLEVRGLARRGQNRFASCRLLQSLRFLSTTADLTTTPHAPPEVALQRGAFLRAALRLAAQRLAEQLGLRGRRTPLGVVGASPPRKAGGALPQAGFSPDTPCHAFMSTLTGEVSAEVEGQVPMTAPADGASAARGRATSPSLPRRGPGSVHPGCLLSRAAPKSFTLAVHRLSPTCGLNPM
jgi:hypothetical protein